MDATTHDLGDFPISPGWAINLKTMHDNTLSYSERLGAGFGASVNTESYIGYLARTARMAGMTWDEIAAPLQITRQTAYARYGQGLPADDDPTLIRLVTGVVHPGGVAVWYGLEDDLPGERNYAHTRGECANAYQLARARADARATELGPSAFVDDSGIDRGSGFFWDFYVEGKVDFPAMV
jgi:hypothetical protein